MMIVDNKQIGFIYKNNKSIDKIFKEGEVVFERGFLREQTSTTLPITYGGVGKDLKDYRVYGNTYQNSTSGKNLYNQIINKKQYGLTIVGDKDKIAINGEQTSTDQKIELGSATLPPGTYTIMIEDLNGMSNLSGWIYIKGAWNRPTSTGLYVNSTTSKKSVTFTLTQANTITYGMYLTTYRPTYNSLIRLSLVSGSTEDYDFEPYTGGQPSPNPDYPQEIVSCGDKTKNMITGLRNSTSNFINFYFDKDMATQNMTLSGIFSYSVSDFSIFLQTSFGNELLLNFQSCTQNEKFSFDIQLTNTQLENIVNSTTTPSVQFYRTGAMSGIGYSEIMLRTSDTTTEYEPYGKYKIPVNVNNVITNIYLDEPLRKIDGYSDYIDFINGKVVRNIGEVILNGSESWTTIQAYGRNYYAVAISDLLISNSGSNDALLYNNYYIGYKSNELVGNNTKDYGICRRNNNSQVLFRDKDQSILSDLTTWLSTHNNIMCYPLATPTEEDIELPNIPTIDGNNTLNIETEITPSQVYIKYKSNT